MSGIGPIQIGTMGIQAGVEQAERAAHEISKIGMVDSKGTSALADLTTASVDLLQAKNQVQASASVILTGDEMLGAIINTAV